MPEDMARAVGAAGAMSVTIAGKECTVRPLGIRELTEAERDCIQRYKRSYLKTFADNIDLFPNGTDLLERKMEEAARWDVDDLPTKCACDPNKIKVTDGLENWLKEQFELKGKITKKRYQQLAATAIDQELMSVDEYKTMTGREVKRTKVPYVNWWITGSFEGMITFVWICFRKDGITRDEVLDELSENQSLLIELSREIERLTAPAVGNG